MRRTPLKTKAPRRTKAQSRYFKYHPRCRVCGKPACDVHHISGNRQDDSDENLESLCWEHHRGDRSVHTIGIIRFCEWFMLTKDLKWQKVYDKAVGKIEFNRQMEELKGEHDT